MLTNLELFDAKRICKSSNPSTFQIRYFTYVLYPKWLDGKVDKYEYDDDKVLTHFKAAKQDFLINQPKDETRTTKRIR